MHFVTDHSLPRKQKSHIFDAFRGSPLRPPPARHVARAEGPFTHWRLDRTPRVGLGSLNLTLYLLSHTFYLHLDLVGQFAASCWALLTVSSIMAFTGSFFKGPPLWIDHVQLRLGCWNGPKGCLIDSEHALGFTLRAKISMV